MKKIKIISVLGIAMVGMSTLLIGCYKDVILPTMPVSGPPPAVSFNAEILPVMTTSCAKSGCHVPGSQQPYMDSAGAYKNLINGGYVNTIVPDQSILYQEINGGPMTVNVPTKDFVNQVYYWIENGAPNN
ncbi:MAG TPA: hypothetical protein VMI35_01920 [Puia sp.]|nr:hypothetical protein [Puia sp.]